MFELNDKNVKKIILIISYAIVLLFILFNFSGAMEIIRIVFNILSPLIYGFCIAFILNIFVNWFEQKYKKKKPKRVLSITLGMIVMLGIILFTFALIIPQLINTLHIFTENINTTISTVKQWTLDITSSNETIYNAVKDFNPNWNSMVRNLLNTIGTNMMGIVGNSLLIITNVYITVLNLFLGLIFAFIMLKNKEKIIKFAKEKLEPRYEKVVNVATIANNKFQSFFAGQLIGALIFGALLYLMFLICGIPYKLELSVLVGVLSLVPIFGIFIGIIIGVLLILAISPIKALVFSIIVFVVMLLNENLIKGAIIGKRLQLPISISIIAVIIGGNNFGILGLLTALPIAATIYEVIKINRKKD